MELHFKLSEMLPCIYISKMEWKKNMKMFNIVNVSLKETFKKI